MLPLPPIAKLIQAINAMINWVGCESCDLWFHSMCVGLGDRSERELEQIDYKCEVCST